MIRKFTRSEQKYLLRHEEVARVMPTLRTRLVPDPEAGGRGHYQVSTLYYDSPSFQLYRTSLEGRPGFKLRLCVFGPIQDRKVTAMVELKIRDGNAVEKERIALPLSSARDLCAGIVPASLEDADEVTFASRIAFLVRRLNLRPALTVSFQRAAWIEPSSGLRVTLDTRLGYRSPTWDLEESVPFREFLAQDQCILSVKSESDLPGWLKQGLCGLPLSRASKYTLGLAQFRSFFKTERPRSVPPARLAQAR